MFRDQCVLMQMCGNNFMVLKVAPPLVVQSAQIEKFVRGIREVVHLAHHSTEFWTEALGLARRAATI
jgi:ornithine--oxo-acid transaminase